MGPHRLLHRIERVESAATSAASSRYGRYVADPVGYATDVLRLATLTADQQTILRSLAVQPCKTLVKSGHEVGKTLVGAVAVCWWYDTRRPSIVLTTAPNYKQVKDLLWKEVRRLRQVAGLGGFVGPKVPRLESASDHFAVGITASSSAGFHGHHGPAVMVVMDEAVGVPRELWEASHTMAHCFLAMFNPTDTTSAAYLEDSQTERPFHRFTMSQLDHPNLAVAPGEALPVPFAVKPAEVEINLRAWSEPVRAEDRQSTDIEWPRGSGRYLRPGPLAESRILGRWPTAGTYGVWSDALFGMAESAQLDEGDGLPQIGCDVACFGDDFTAIHARWGPVSLHHESVNGRSPEQTAGRLKQLCVELGRRCDCLPERIPVLVDRDGPGYGVLACAEEFNFIAVSSANVSSQPDRYPNRRSELWFAACDLAKAGQMSLAALPADVRQRLKQQAMAPLWRLDTAGRQVVEPKDDTKSKIGRSPDDMDALNLAYYDGAEWMAPDVMPELAREKRKWGR